MNAQTLSALIKASRTTNFSELEAQLAKFTEKYPNGDIPLDEGARPFCLIISDEQTAKEQFITDLNSASENGFPILRDLAKGLDG